MWNSKRSYTKAVEDLTLAKAQELAVGMEAATKNANEIQGGAGSKDHELYTLSAASKTCYRCGSKGSYRQ